MISARILQNSYQNMYEEVRRYVWDIDTVEVLAELEISIFSAFPNMAKVKKFAHKFESLAHEAMKKDKELSKAVTKLIELVDSESITYHNIYQVREVLI